MNRIASLCTYVPRNVLTREAAREAWPQIAMPFEARSVASLDEDVITMGADAALGALDLAGISGDSLRAVLFATTSSPYTVKSAAALIADYVGAPRTVRVIDLGAGSQAGLAGLVLALGELPGPTLVVASDALHGAANDSSDLGYGAAAAAAVIGADGFASLVNSASAYSSYSATWSAKGDTCIRRYDDERFEREVGFRAQMTSSARAFLAEGDVVPDLVALHANSRSSGETILQDLGIPRDRLAGSEELATVGDAGCAAAFLALAAALRRGRVGDTVFAQSYGAGAGTVSLLARIESDPTPSVVSSTHARGSARALNYVQYAKHRGLLPMPGLPELGSPYAASPGSRRDLHSTIGLMAGRCESCGSLNFPTRSYCIDCRGERFTDVRLPRRGRVVTFNIQHVVGIGPEEAPLPVCTVLLEGEPADRYGGKVSALITDAPVESVSVGQQLELVPRRGDVEAGLVNYGWKFRPLVNGGAG